MFTLSRIAVKNFMSIAEQEIEFNEGILGITGENGSGKSSLLNAIGLCLTEYRSEERRVGKECRSRWSPYH